MDSVALIGMPGAGKSTVGVQLARYLALDFVDTDLLIQVREGRTLQQILDASGYLRLRAIEAEVLLAIDPAGKVVATGGSAVYSDAAMRHLGRHGPVVFVDASLTDLARRLPDLTARGIAGPPGSTLATLAAERVPLYRRYGDLVVTSSGGSADSTARAIALALAAREGNGIR